MGWNWESDDGTEYHEGYLLGVLGDGSIPVYRDMPLQMTFMGGYWSGGLPDDPGQDPAWVLPACDCNGSREKGWRGVRVPYSRAEHGDNDPDDGYAQWQAHIAQVDASTVPAAITAAIGALFDALNDDELRARSPLATLGALKGVRRGLEEQIRVFAQQAHQQGTSWEGVGRALGVDEQRARALYGETETAASGRDAPWRQQ